MANFNSDLVNKRVRHRGLYGGMNYRPAGTIFLPSGTALTTNDDLLFVPVGENMSIERVELLVIGDTSTIAGSIGYFQMLDANGNPVVVQTRGPEAGSAYDYTSPASDDDAFRAAGQLDGYTETVLATPLKLAGPVNVGISITTAGTIAADTEMRLTVVMDGRVSPDSVSGGYSADNDYLLG